MTYLGISFTIIFILLGSILMCGKGIRLISVYNMLSKARKATIRKEALCRFMGKIFFCFAIGSMFWIIGDLTNSLTVVVLGMVIIVFLAIFSTIFILTSSHFHD